MPALAIGDSTPIVAIMTGKVAPYGPKGEPSAYVKHRIEGDIEITSLGLEGDEHAGGDKLENALHHYPFDHYASFAIERPDLVPILRSQPAFAENLSTVGWMESHVCLGDRFQLGTAELELSQGRAPCWKLGHRFGDPKMINAVVTTRRAGWYYRVTKPGRVRAGDVIALVSRTNPDWSVARAFGLLVGSDTNPDALAELVGLPGLGASWLKRGRQRLGTT
jgi:MOSC domain-containing protein YiiM